MIGFAIEGVELIMLFVDNLLFYGLSGMYLVLLKR